MINANNKKLKTMIAVLAVLALAVGIFRTVILYNFVEPETGFYIAGTNMDVIFNSAVVALVLVIGAFAIAVRKIKAPDFLDSHSTIVVFTSALCAFLFITRCS